MICYLWIWTVYLSAFTRLKTSVISLPWSVLIWIGMPRNIRCQLCTLLQTLLVWHSPPCSLMSWRYRSVIAFLRQLLGRTQRPSHLDDHLSCTPIWGIQFLLICHGHCCSIHGVAQEMSTHLAVSSWWQVHRSQTLQDHGDASLII